MPDFWGKHLLLDCTACDIPSITSEKNIRAFVYELVEKIDMELYGEPILEHFATHDPEKGGYTLCAMITTSLIDGHFVDSNGNAFLSIHSCRDFHDMDVREVVRKYFNPKAIKSTTVLRKA